MARLANLCGIVLILIGVGFYIATGLASWTALIPVIPGAVLIACGLIGAQESRRKLAMHIAAAIALLGVLAMFGRAIPSILDGGIGTLPVIEQLVAGVVLLYFLVRAVQSFIAARRG